MTEAPAPLNIEAGRINANGVCKLKGREIRSNISEFSVDRDDSSINETKYAALGRPRSRDRAAEYVGYLL
jgi:hypothetical protein